MQSLLFVLIVHTKIQLLKDFVINKEIETQLDLFLETFALMCCGEHMSAEEEVAVYSPR